MTMNAGEFEQLSSQEKRARLAALLAQKAAAPKQYPLSFAQQRLWFLAQLEPNASVYNIPAALRLKGRVDIAALEHSLTEIVRRHGTLHTTFKEVDGQAVQVVAPTASVSLPVFDLRGRARPEREELAARRTAEEAGRPFNLQEGPLFRPALFQLDEQDFILLLTFHHIISDGWSLGIFVREFAELYDAFTSSRAPALPPLPVQYADYAVWQRARSDTRALDAGIAYWRDRLAGLSPLELPSARPRPPARSFRGARVSFRLPAPLVSRLHALCRAEGVTPFMALLAAFDLLLYRYTGQADIAVGTPVANRGRSEVEGLIGMFVNTLVLRTELSGDLNFRELLGRVRAACLGAYQHQEVPFERLVEELAPERELSRSPLFQVMFDVEVARPGRVVMGGVEGEVYEVGNATAKYDLTVSLGQREEGEWEGVAEYDSDLYEGEMDRSGCAGTTCGCWRRRSVAPCDAVGALPMLSAAERHRLLREYNPATPPPPAPAPLLHELFARQARLTPSALAVSDAHRALTYAEVAGRAVALAHALRRLGVGPETRVGVCLERGVELVAALLGVLGAGSAYVPLDPAYPSARLRSMVEDAGAGWVVTDGAVAEAVGAALGGTGARLLLVDEVWGAATAGTGTAAGVSAAASERGWPRRRPRPRIWPTSSTRRARRAVPRASPSRTPPPARFSPGRSTSTRPPTCGACSPRPRSASTSRSSSCSRRWRAAGGRTWCRACRRGRSRVRAGASAWSTACRRWWPRRCAGAGVLGRGCGW